MFRPAGWSGCGSSPTVLPSRRGVLGGKRGSLLKVNWYSTLVHHPVLDPLMLNGLAGGII